MNETPPHSCRARGLEPVSLVSQKSRREFLHVLLESCSFGAESVFAAFKGSWPMYLYP